MKRLGGALLLLGVCVAFLVSCGADDKVEKSEAVTEVERVENVETKKVGPDEVVQMIKSLNSECPVTLQDGLTVVEVADGGEYIEFVVEYDERLLTLDTDDEAVKEQQDNFVRLFNEMIETSPEIKTVDESGMGIHVTYVGSESRKKFSFVIINNSSLKK